jgi:hypothetical protein
VGARDPRIDIYIQRAAPFAVPILRHLREVVHAACPEVVETMKWSSPFFDHHGPMCHMAAFKQHAAFGFWKGELVAPSNAGDPARGQFGRLTKVSDLPSKRQLTAYVREAMRLNEAGVPAPHVVKRAAPKPPPVPPEDFLAALGTNASARRHYEGFSPSQQREYVDWIVEAKRAQTRAQRIGQAIEWLADGKIRHWRYL